LGFLVLFSRLAHSHPAVLYLVFHFYAVTMRLLGVSLETQTVFGRLINQGFYLPVTDSEIIRAALIADISLIVMTIAWVKASVDAKKKDRESDGAFFRRLSKKYVLAVVAVAFPIGIIGLTVYGRLPGRESSELASSLGAWETSSWLFITMTWPGLVLLALIYLYGFRWWLTFLISLYLLLMMYQGYHRFRVIIPIILMTQIYLDRHRLKWPKIRYVVVLAGLFLLFFPLKSIGRAAQLAFSEDKTKQVSVEDIVNTSVEGIQLALTGGHDDQQILDQCASALTLIDESGNFYYGGTYLPLLTSPIPRQWWPEKPGLVDYIGDISKPWRPMKEMGMTPTFWGEAYANFGYLGIVMIPGLLAYGLGRAYFYAYRGPYFSVARFAYLLVACNLIQVFRDGMISLVVFTFVNMMPLMVIVLLHYVMPLLVGKTNHPEVTLESHQNQIPFRSGMGRLST